MPRINRSMLLVRMWLSVDNLWDEWSDSADVECDYSKGSTRVERLQSLEVRTDNITS